MLDYALMQPIFLLESLAEGEEARVLALVLVHRVEKLDLAILRSLNFDKLALPVFLIWCGFDLS